MIIQCGRGVQTTVIQIAVNSGVEGSIVVGKVLENKSQSYGFDAQTEQYVDMLNAGIVDPAKVVRVRPCPAAGWAAWNIDQLRQRARGRRPRPRSHHTPMPADA